MSTGVRERRRGAGPLVGGTELLDPAADVNDLLGRITTALDLGGDRLDPDDAAAARQVVERVGSRASLGLDQTVVAFAGATGSGKSSLFNATTGFEVSTVGVRRPTTSTAVACTWSPGADLVLDWLEVPEEHRTVRGKGLVGDRDHLLEGLVLLDLPDHDSREFSHRKLVDRLVRRMDLLIWVVDPQKYADRAIHDDYLVPLQGHDDVLVVVLNQVDKLSEDDTAAVLADLRRLLVRDGLSQATVLATSAVTGQGLDSLRLLLEDAVASRAMATVRARADLLDVAATLRASMADGEAQFGSAESDPALTAALSSAASVPVVLSGIERDYERQAARYVSWPLTRWLDRLRSDPLKRLRLQEPGLPTDLATLAHSSVPEPTRAQLARVDLAEGRLVDKASEGLPPSWAEAVRQAPDRSVDLRDALDRAVLSTDLDFPRPGWWTAVGVAQLVLVVSALLGFVGLAAFAVLGVMQLLGSTSPGLAAVAVPTVLAVGGLFGGLLLAFLAGSAVPRQAARRREEAENRLVTAVAAVARERVLAPVSTVLAEHRHCRELLDR